MLPILNERAADELQNVFGELNRECSQEDFVHQRRRIRMSLLIAIHRRSMPTRSGIALPTSRILLSQRLTCHEHPTGNETSCICPSNLSGSLCENAVDSMARCVDPSPCLNGFSGPRCADNVNDCLDPSVCLNGGICIDGINNFTCHGRHQGQCVDTPGVETHECVCLTGLTGIPSDGCVNIDDCLSNPCRNNGTCTNGINGFQCTCTGSGFDGIDCSDEINECEPSSPCHNSATCVDGVGIYTCLFPAGYEGRDCQTDVYESITDDPPGWTGRHSDVDIDECANSPCLNNGTCLNQLNAFQCQCPNGFLGEHCEVNRDNCLADLCRNNGTCLDQVANYTCVCPAEFMGRHCEQEFDACASLPCKNGASCITTRPQSHFYCECLPGFEGMYCENNIGECFSVQCVDGKQCFDLINGYECRCPVGFTGHLCQENINDCVANPCQNGGSCIDGIGNYTCSCPPGFTGRNCSEDIDECTVLKPCVYGSYQCYCRPGFSGDNCNLEFDECLSHPCQNNGTCNNLINGYECVCSPGFTGKDCDININECESNPCQNNGTCIDGIAGYSCICLAGFTGLLARSTSTNASHHLVSTTDSAWTESAITILSVSSSSPLIKSGNITRIVEIFPLDKPSRNELPDSLGTVERSNDVLQGVVSDNNCRTDPCFNGGASVGGQCHNLNDGYECLSSATFNGVNSTVEYTSLGIDGSSTELEQTVEFSFRSKQGGTVLMIQNEGSVHVRFLRLDIENRGVVIRWIAKSGLVVNESLYELLEALDGSWHYVSLNLPSISR
uniref:EGF-like domain-containing protein n=1 Tax=Daphnia galeata TaxID=27404 RepID=A0A8J2RJN1_9CRUS|nr:unnamed protein product [Daphnia galeata]